MITVGPGAAGHGFVLHLVHQVRVLGPSGQLRRLRRVLIFMPNGPWVHARLPAHRGLAAAVPERPDILLVSPGDRSAGPVILPARAASPC